MFVTIVLDGVGIGEAPDADQYGDVGSNTLAHVCERVRPELPNLARLGLGRLAPLTGVPPADSPLASLGTMRAVSAGKDSTSGHWELAGLKLERPFPTHPGGFPQEVLDAFVRKTGCGGVLANKPASGTEVIAAYGAEHLATGHPILYNSADSVFQLATHTRVVPLDTLYEWCRIARTEVCVGEHAVGRVIARPFEDAPAGANTAFQRISEARKDFALLPPAPTIQAQLQDQGVTTVSVGKIGDLFANDAFDVFRKTRSNAEGISETLAAIREATPRTFIWTNLVDFDQLFGHRNDPEGFGKALEEFDRAVPELLAALPAGARLAITADHGNDPCFPGTDHTREIVPILLVEKDGPGWRHLGERATFADHAASVAAHFGIDYSGSGESFI